MVLGTFAWLVINGQATYEPARNEAVRLLDGLRELGVVTGADPRAFQGNYLKFEKQDTNGIKFANPQFKIVVAPDSKKIVALGAFYERSDLEFAAPSTRWDQRAARVFAAAGYAGEPIEWVPSENYGRNVTGYRTHNGVRYEGLHHGVSITFDPFGRLENLIVQPLPIPPTVTLKPSAELSERAVATLASRLLARNNDLVFELVRTEFQIASPDFKFMPSPPIDERSQVERELGAANRGVYVHKMVATMRDGSGKVVGHWLGWMDASGTRVLVGGSSDMNSAAKVEAKEKPPSLVPDRVIVDGTAFNVVSAKASRSEVEGGKDVLVRGGALFTRGVLKDDLLTVSSGSARKSWIVRLADRRKKAK